MPGIPEHLLRRSAEAKARATGRPVEEILAELIAEAEEAAEERSEAAARREAATEPGAEEPAAAEPPEEEEPEPEAAEPAPEAAETPAAETPAAEAPAAEAPAAAAATAGLPEHLLRRSAEAKARATGRPVEEILAEMQGGAPPAPAEPSPAAAEPAAAPAAVPEPPPAAEEPVAVPAAAAPTPEPAAAPAAAAATLAPWDLPDVPEHLIARSRAARAKADGLTTAAAPAGGGGAPAAAAATATAPAPQPAGPPAIPEGVRAQRLLTVVKAGAIQQVKTEPTDKVNTWPHLIAAEFVALLVVTAALTIFSAFVDAPLLELANFNEQPNPSKAPWYFLGLQELLSYFDPQVAGVLIPGLGLAGLAAIPYVDRNPSTRPADRKLAIMVFTFFMMGSALLTIWGSFYRGPGFNFTFPWNDGLFFDF